MARNFFLVAIVVSFIFAVGSVPISKTESLDVFATSPTQGLVSLKSDPTLCLKAVSNILSQKWLELEVCSFDQPAQMFKYSDDLTLGLLSTEDECADAVNFFGFQSLGEGSYLDFQKCSGKYVKYVMSAGSTSFFVLRPGCESHPSHL